MKKKFVHDHLVIEAILRYARGEAVDAEEYILLKEWQMRKGEGRPLQDLINDQEWLCISLNRLHGLPAPSDWERFKQRVVRTGDPLPEFRVDRRRLGGAMATVALVICAVVGWIYQPHKRTAPQVAAGNGVAAIVAGQEAELILNDGSPIWIDRVADNSIVAEDSNTTVRKVAPYTLRYEHRPGRPAGTMRHRFSAGRNHAYKLMFACGSVIYAKRGSHIRYPIALQDAVDPVELEGEAGFSIIKSGHLPLMVVTDGIKVDVPESGGTETDFAITGNKDDSLTVGVYQGQVTVRQGATKMMLKDSDEVILARSGVTAKRLGDFDGLLSWTDIDRHYHFDSCSLVEAVQQIADHYQINVSNLCHIEGIRVKGSLRQNLSIKDLLDALQEMECQQAVLTYHDRTIVISPNMRS
jgi:ferric-dicitrate binding protein FerR (iron transport regulator)